LHANVSPISQIALEGNRIAAWDCDTFALPIHSHEIRMGDLRQLGIEIPLLALLRAVAEEFIK